MSPPANVSRDLERLRTLLSALPSKAPATGTAYPFENFTPDDEWVENTGSLQGSVNHTLEVAFGCRATTGNVPIELTSHGPDLLAVVDVLATYITGHDGENPILIKWIDDLTRAAEATTEGEAGTLGGSLGKRARKLTEKREQMEKDNEAKASAKRKRVEEASQTAKAKEKTAGNWEWDPEDLEDDPPDPKTIGRPSIPLLDKLAKNCRSRKTPTMLWWRCVALACGYSKARPRSQARVYPHAAKCEYLDLDLVEEAATALSKRTVSNLTKLNAPDRARQKTRTLIGMAQVKQHELRLQNAVNEEPGLAVRFRDLSDLIKDSRRPLSGSEQGRGATSGGGTGNPEAPNTLDSEDHANQATGRFEEPDTWEQEIGLDEVIERPESGSRGSFEVTESDGINLNAPVLLDLLSEEPVDGAIGLPTDPAVEKGKKKDDSKDKERVSVAHFEF